MQAINAVIEDLNIKTDKANEDFEARTLWHESEERRLTDLINEASRNIAEAHELIDNVLVPQRNQLTEEIANLQRQIEETKEYIEKITAERETAHNDYLVRVDEHNSAISAIAEALSILSQLNGEEPSLIQMKRVQRSIDKIKANIQGKRMVEATFIKSLLALTSGGFVNQDALQKVEDLLVETKFNLEKSLVEEDAAEEKEQADFEADVEHQQSNIVQDTASVNQKSDELARTEEQIANTYEYIDEREADRTGFTNDLNAENDAFVEATNTYNDLIATLEQEESACNDALSVIQGATIEDYIGGRMEQTSAHVIGTNHGSGVRVGGDDIHFQ